MKNKVIKSLRMRRIDSLGIMGLNKTLMAVESLLKTQSCRKFVV